MSKQKVDVQWANVQDDDKQDFFVVKTDCGTMTAGFADVPTEYVQGLLDGLCSIGLRAHTKKVDKWGRQSVVVFSASQMPKQAVKMALDMARAAT